MSKSETPMTAEEHQREYWARCRDLQERLYRVACDMREHGIPTHAQSRECWDAIHAVINAIPRERGYQQHVQIAVKYL